MSLEQLNSEMAASFNVPVSDNAGAFYNTSLLSLPVPARYNEQEIYAAPIASNNIGTTAPVNQETSFLDQMTAYGRRLLEAGAARAEQAVAGKVTGPGTGDKHITPGSNTPAPTNQQSIVPGVPNLILFVGVGFLVWRVVK